MLTVKPAPVYKTEVPNSAEESVPFISEVYKYRLIPGLSGQNLGA